MTLSDLAKYSIRLHEASRGLSATVELLVLNKALTFAIHVLILVRLRQSRLAKRIIVCPSVGSSV